MVQQLSDDFDPSQFKDEYHKALKKLIDRKIKGEDIVVAEEPKQQDAGVVDLMEALKASVEAARQGKKPSASSEPAARKKNTAPKKTAGKKTGAKKTSAKKTTKQKKKSA